MFSTSDFRNGLKIEIDGQPFEILDFQHSKVGRGGAHVRTKLRNILSGSVMEHTFRSGEKVAKPDLEVKDMQYIYRDGDAFVFMDLSTYDQIHVPEKTLGNKGSFLTDGQEVKVVTYQGEVIDLQLPASVLMEVVETEPGVKGDTVSGATKQATLEGGLVVNVPLFVETGEKVKVDTRSVEYLGRA